MKLPKITKKQEEILILLYRYRFLNRIQVQTLLGHKDKRRIITWLKDLREKQYVEWIYSTDFTEKTKPAIYYININGLRFLRTVESETATGCRYPQEEISKRYKEHKRSRTFVDHSVLVAQCCLALEAFNVASADKAVTDSNKNNVFYTYFTEADYIDTDHAYHFLAEHQVLRPNLCIIKKKNQVITNYLLEIFDSTLPRYRLRKRLKEYVKYVDQGDWEMETGCDDPPTILLVCTNLTELIYAKRATRKLLLDIYDEPEDIPNNVHIRFTTTEQLIKHGIVAGLWEEGRQRFSI